MTVQELQAGIEAVERRAAVEINKLRHQFVAENALYHIGEIIYDSSDMIRIERIRFSTIYAPYPVIYYEGPKLKRNGKPFKSGAWASVFEERAHKYER